MSERTAARSFTVQQLKIPHSTALFGVILSQFLSLLTIPFFSALSDRIGRRPVYLGAALWSAAWAFPFFLLCETKEPTLIWIAFTGATAIGTSGMLGPQAAYYSELFGPRVRFGGFAFARELI
jgi:MFS family permease